MTDIARLGFSVATDQLSKGVAALKRLKPAGDVAASAVDKVAGASDRAASASTRMASGVQQATGATSRSATGANAAGGAWSRFVDRLRAVRPAASAATGGLNKLGKAANDNIGRLQATPGNIAAQFQDVGVTAAAGMSPMLIALQQGTQLSAAFAGGGLSSLDAAIRQVISPTAILTIGIVALVAAGIQMVDWATVAKTALNGLADAADAAAPYIVYLGAVLLIAFGPKILTAIYAITTAIVVGFIGAVQKATFALIAFSLANPFAAAVIAIGLLVGAAVIMGDKLTKILGFDIVAAARSGVNFIIGGFVGAYNTITKTWSMLPAAIGDAVIQAANNTIVAIDNMVNSAIKSLNKVLAVVGMSTIDEVAGTQFDNPFAGSAATVGGIAQAEISSAQSVDYVGLGIEMGKGLVNYAADKLRGLASGIGADEDGKTEKAAKGRTKTAKKEFTFEDLIGEANERIRILKQENDLIGLQGFQLARLRAEQSLMNKALKEGLTLDEEQIIILKSKADEIARQSELNRKDEFIVGINQDTAEQDFDYEQQRREIFLTGEALRASQIEYELLRKARLANIKLTPTEIAAMGEIARSQAEVETAISRTRETIDAARDITKSFFQDFRDNLLEGQSLWGSFADAADAALDRIIKKLSDQLFDKAIDQLINFGLSLIPGGSFAKGGTFGGVSSLTGQQANKPTWGGATEFANGGAFTNSIVDRPTAFAFGKGGANLGIMGEAGAEAIMPLKRGSDGSLGVQMYNGGGGGGGGNISVDARSFTTLSGALSSKDIVDLQKKQAEQTENKIKRSIVPWLEKYKIDGALN